MHEFSFKAHGKSHGRVSKIFVTLATAFTGGSLCTAIGIQQGMKTLTAKPGRLAEELRVYERLKSDAKRAGRRTKVGEQAEVELETRLIKGNLIT